MPSRAPIVRCPSAGPAVALTLLLPDVAGPLRRPDAVVNAVRRNVRKRNAWLRFARPGHRPLMQGSAQRATGRVVRWDASSGTGALVVDSLPTEVSFDADAIDA